MWGDMAGVLGAEDLARDGGEVAGAGADVEEGEAWPEVERLEGGGVDGGRLRAGAERPRPACLSRAAASGRGGEAGWQGDREVDARAAERHVGIRARGDVCVVGDEVGPIDS